MLSRRDLLKLGLLGGGYALFSSGRRFATAGEHLHIAPSGSPGALPYSPRLEPFLDPLPLPPEPLEVSAFPGTIRHDCLDFVDVGPGKTRWFRLVEEERRVKIHTDLPHTTVWGFRDASVQEGAWPYALGPTFRVNVATRRGQGALVRVENRLPTESRSFGVPITTTHLHGGHLPAASDGFATDLDGFPAFTVHPGERYDYCFPMLDPGSLSDLADESERASTMWYHDHLLDHTAENVYKGLVGLYLVFDEKDSGDERSTDERALRLPSGPFDIPLVLQDKTVDEKGQLVYMDESHDGFLGDTFLVNGMVQPYFRVKRRKYRFRLLNGSNARFYQIFISDTSGRTSKFDQIATEGGLLAAPIRDLESFRIGPAERVEIVVDFRSFREGDTVFLENRMRQKDGRRPDKVEEEGIQLLKFVVGETVEDPSRVPDVLRPFASVSERDLRDAVRREFRFDRRGGLWTINGIAAHHLETAMAEPALNVPEVWTLVNNSGGWFHPIHVHSEFGRVLKRNGETPPLDERDGMARKDTIILGNNDVVEVFFKFRDYTGPFVFHCHTIEHEDFMMMGRFDVVEPNTAGQTD